MPHRLGLSTLALVTMTSLAAFADAPQVPYQVVTTGRLLDGNDQPVTGMQTLTFGLYVASVRPQHADAPVWTETYAVQCDANGLYRAVLGGESDDSGATGKKALAPSVFRANPELYLEVKVDETALAPRLPVASTPYALFAATAGDADTLGGHGADYFATAASDASKLAGLTAAAPMQVDDSDPTRPALALPAATSTDDGYLAHDDFAIFSAKVAQVSSSAPLVTTGDALHPSLSIAPASATADGYLAQADYRTFAAKQDALSVVAPLSLDGSGHLDLALATDASLAGVGTSTSPLHVAFDGSGTASTAARSDHNHDATYVRRDGTSAFTGPQTGPLTLAGAFNPQAAIDLSGGGWIKADGNPGQGGSGDFWIGRGGGSGVSTLAFYAPASGGLEFGIANQEKMHLASNGDLALTGSLNAGGDVDVFHESVAATENVRAFFPKSSANAVCPSGSTAIFTPWNYRGETGSQICAQDSRDKTICTAVKFVYCTEGNNCGTYPAQDASCSDRVDYPWPWGQTSGPPDTLDGEWGHPDLYVVCCQ